MKTELAETVKYHLMLDDKAIVLLNDFLAKKITLNFTGKIFDVYDGKLIKKSFGQGYSYKNFISLARCDSCVVKPELCHYEKGTCREPDWGLEHCFIPHYIYLAKTSDVKIGITRHTQIPTRWMDQGAVEAMPILKVNDRKTSGLIEVEIARIIPDKTNWRKMLSGEVMEGPSLEEYKELVFDSIPHLLDDLDAEEVEEPSTCINYPVIEYPKKIISLNFDKNPEVSGTLLGIKGQYLILDCGVINLRKYSGYEIEFSG